MLGLRLLGGAVGEVFKLLLVDLSDDGLVRGRQHGVLLGEVLVKVIHISLGLLQRHTRTHTEGKDSEEESSLQSSALKVMLERHLLTTETYCPFSENNTHLCMLLPTRVTRVKGRLTGWESI